MKLVSFTAGGKASYGAVVGERVVDLGKRLGGQYPTLRDAIAGGALSGAAASGNPDLSLSEVTLLPPVPAPDKVLCVGKNYKGHVVESGAKLPDFPSLFLRLNNTLVAHGAPLIRPRVSQAFDFEGELAVIIGEGGRHIAKADALKHVFGYSIFMDASLRDYQGKHSLTAGKNFHATGGFGPCIVTADEIPDPTQLMLHTYLNGTEVQHTKTDDMIFDIPTVIAYVSAFTPLEPGDVIATGTPEGVGNSRDPKLWMKPGDTIEVDISGIGRLQHAIVDEA